MVLLTGGEARGRRLQTALAAQRVPASYCATLDGNLIAREVLLLPVSYTKGFVNLPAGLCVISDSDIYGTAYQRARKKQTAGERIASFTDLKAGDYVVHDLHGVGLFKGVVQLENDGARRDYLLIQDVYKRQVMERFQIHRGIGLAVLVPVIEHFILPRYDLFRVNVAHLPLAEAGHQLLVEDVFFCCLLYTSGYGS